MRDGLESGQAAVRDRLIALGIAVCASVTLAMATWCVSGIFDSTSFAIEHLGSPVQAVVQFVLVPVAAIALAAPLLAPPAGHPDRRTSEPILVAAVVLHAAVSSVAVPTAGALALAFATGSAKALTLAPSLAVICAPLSIYFSLLAAEARRRSLVRQEALSDSPDRVTPA